MRATYESADYTRFVGQSRSFPGYPEAVGGPTRRSNADKEDFFTSAEPGEDEQIALTNFLHITGYAETATGIGATVCSYNLHTDPGVNLSVEGLNLAYRIELERIGEDGLPGIPDTDPARHDPRANRLPLWNVFDGWKITKLRYLRPTKGDEMPQGCIDWWLRQLPGFTQNASAVVVPPARIRTSHHAGGRAVSGVDRARDAGVGDVTARECRYSTSAHSRRRRRSSM